jgi:hypothetical protein
MFKQFAIASALAVSAVAQVSSPPSAPLMLPQHAPMRLHRVPTTPGSVESENWSGYAATGTGFTNAQGSWVVPKVSCAKTLEAYSAFWVGIDGYSSDTVEQTGTMSLCFLTEPEYYAWYEFYPAASVEITSVPVTPGDTISASVTYNGSDFTITITNETTGKTYSKSGTVSGAQRSSAEWIAEAPSSTSGVLPLADFGTVSFGDDYTGVVNTNYATDDSITGPISDFGTAVEEITMVSSKGKTEAVPSALSTDGSSFTVAWKSK